MPNFTTNDLPDALIFEDEPLLEIAKAMPTFAGFYYNARGEVEIALTNPAGFAEAVTRIRPWLGAHRASSARFTARIVTYSFLELARYRTVLRQQVFGIPGVVSIGVRESANRVKVGIEDPRAEEDVRNLMLALSVPQAAVIFVPEGRGRQMSLANGERLPARTSLTLQDKQPNGLIQGGWEINSAAGTCTLGFAALRVSDALPVFVTNSHCTSVRTHDDGTTFVQPTGSQVGHEIDDPDSYDCGYIGFRDDCRHSDSALIEADVPIDLGRIARTTQASPIGCEECSEPLTVDSAQPTFIISGRIDNVFEDETLNKVGRSSGWTRGNVEDTCDDIESEIDGSNDPWVKQCSDRVDYASDPGDSGSPVFSMAGDGTVILRGIHHTHSDCCLGYNDAWMSDLNQIENDLCGLTVFDPGLPVVTIVGPTEVRPNVYCSWSTSVAKGVPPFTYQWSGMFSGPGPSIDGFVGSDGDLTVKVTDGLGRQDTHQIHIVVEGAPGPLTCF